MHLNVDDSRLGESPADIGFSSPPRHTFVAACSTYVLVGVNGKPMSVEPASLTRIDGLIDCSKTFALRLMLKPRRCIIFLPYQRLFVGERERDVQTDRRSERKRETEKADEKANENR